MRAVNAWFNNKNRKYARLMLFQDDRGKKSEQKDSYRKLNANRY